MFDSIFKKKRFCHESSHNHFFNLCGTELRILSEKIRDQKNRKTKNVKMEGGIKPPTYSLYHLAKGSFNVC